MMTPLKQHPSTQKEPEELFDELLNIKVCIQHIILQHTMRIMSCHVSVISVM
jgi:hypothetical protein